MILQSYYTFRSDHSSRRHQPHELLLIYMIISINISIPYHLANILILKRPVYAQQKRLQVGKRYQFIFIPIDRLKSQTHIRLYLRAIDLTS